MGVIGLNKVLFASALFWMKRSAYGINVSSEEWTPMGENTKVFDVYLAEYVQLQTIFQKYQELVLKDIKEIETIGTELIRIDQKLIDMWK